LPASEGTIVAFTDADLAYSPQQLTQVVGEVERGAHMAVGTRTSRATLASRSIVRRLTSRLFTLLVGTVLDPPRQDTPCGLKAFRGEVARNFAEALCVDGFAFDVELFCLAEQAQLVVAEVPVTPTADDASTVRLTKHVPEMVRDLLRIRRRLRAGRYRQASDPVLTVVPV
jgi:hypothetical protein